jgi:hypothetical protein
MDIAITGRDCVIQDTKTDYIQKCNDRNALNEMIAKIRQSQANEMAPKGSLDQ